MVFILNKESHYGQLLSEFIFTLYTHTQRASEYAAGRLRYETASLDKH
jgi:hypothetical protein